MVWGRAVDVGISTLQRSWPLADILHLSPLTHVGFFTDCDTQCWRDRNCGEGRRVATLEIPGVELQAAAAL